jgi:hypothetical protein
VKFAEEDYARELHQALSLKFAEVTINGAGVHWQCKLKVGIRSCTVDCFEDRFNRRIPGPEYSTAFEENGEIVATGRAESISDAVSAISEWLAASSITNLQKRFAFVDKRKRELVALRDSVVGDFPELGPLAVLKNTTYDFHELNFRRGDRACRVYFYGKKNFSDAYFLWDECELFKFVADDPRKFALVLKRWIGDAAMPSSLRKEFPWIQIGDLAAYYEHGNPVEGEFLESWNKIETFYQRWGVQYFPVKGAVLDFISELRRRGYDKKLRAGQSLVFFILSRSRRHGLQEKQPHVVFRFQHHGGIEIDMYFESEEKLSVPKIGITPEIEKILDRLSSLSID